MNVRTSGGASDAGSLWARQLGNSILGVTVLDVVDLRFPGYGADFACNLKADVECIQATVGKRDATPWAMEGEQPLVRLTAKDGVRQPKCVADHPGRVIIGAASHLFGMPMNGRLLSLDKILVKSSQTVDGERAYSQDPTVSGFKSAS